MSCKSAAAPSEADPSAVASCIATSSIESTAYDMVPRCSFLSSISAQMSATAILRRRRTVLRERARLVREQILDPAELLGQGARTDDRVGNLRIVHDLRRVDSLAHVEVDAQPEQSAQSVSPTHEIGMMDEKRMRKRKT